MPEMTIEANGERVRLPLADQDVDSKFVDAPEVERIARKLIAMHHSHLVEAKIKYLFRKGDWMSKGDVVLGKAYKASDRDKYLHGFDFLIVINRDYWPVLNDAQREAAVDHELCHCSRGEDTADGAPRWEIRNHTVEEFTEIIQRHGLWKEDVKAFIEVGIEAKRQLTLYDLPSEERRVANG